MYLFDYLDDHGVPNFRKDDGSTLLQRFPKNQPPCKLIVIEIADNEMFIQFDGKHARSKKRPSKVSREQRTTEIRAIFHSPIHLAEIRVPKAGSIQFIGRPASILELPNSTVVPLEFDLTCYYKRNSKRKVINAVFLNNDSSAVNANVALGRYDHFYACDANSWTFLEIGKVSICVAFHGWLTLLPGERCEAKFTKKCVITIKGDMGGNPEFRAARELIVGLQQSIPNLPIKPIGIIVDSDLGRLRDINARRAPLIDDFFLPLGFEIMYASDATGTTEFFVNMLIRMCDKASTELLLEHANNNNLTKLAV